MRSLLNRLWWITIHKVLKVRWFNLFFLLSWVLIFLSFSLDVNVKQYIIIFLTDVFFTIGLLYLFVNSKKVEIGLLISTGGALKEALENIFWEFFVYQLLSLAISVPLSIALHILSFTNLHLIYPLIAFVLINLVFFIVFIIFVRFFDVNKFLRV